MDKSLFRELPKMDVLLSRPAVDALCSRYSREAVKACIRDCLDELRASDLTAVPGIEEIESAVCRRVSNTCGYHLKPLINGTGVVLHTNLGRAPMSTEAAQHIAEVAEGYSNLEFDLSTGKRGTRYSLVEDQLCKITGAEAALVVNNNAAGVFLMLNTIAKGKKVAVSRGELVEIGGSFRVPEIMVQSGAELAEIGTTNKTHPSDYVRAIEEQEASALLKVHSSNFKMIGFTESVELPELRRIADEHQVPLLYDLGAGFLIRPELLGLHEGASVQEAVKYADVVGFSGDKLMGASQAGILLGKKCYIDAMKKNQLTRMLRVDKLTLAALDDVLRWYRDPAAAKEKIPVLRMLSYTREELRPRAVALKARLEEVSSLRFEVVNCTDEPGGGSLPGVYLDGCAIAVTGKSPDKLEKALRDGTIPVIGRISEQRLLLSLRTISARDEEQLVSAFEELEQK